MFRNKNIFQDLKTYVQNLENMDTCPNISIKSPQKGGKTYNSLNSSSSLGSLDNSDKYKNQYGVFPAVRRIIAIGDIHGDFNALIQALYKANIITTDGDWDANNTGTIVIQLGDLLDRGGRNNPDSDNYREEIDILQFIQHLHKQASKIGSAFLTLVGNHELMNLLGDFRYVSENAMNGMGGDKGREYLFKAGGPIAKHIGCSSYGICKIGDWTFVHGGVLPQHLNDPEFSFTNVNYLIRDIMMGKLEKQHLTSSQKEFIFGSNGLFWTRKLSKDTPECSLADEAVSILNDGKQNGGIVVGHTVQPKINSKCSGKVWAIDSGMSDAFGKTGTSKIQVLEISNNKTVNIL
jgi:hypothetical protein